MTTFEGTRVIYIYVKWKRFTSIDQWTNKKMAMNEWGVIWDYRYFGAVPDSDLLYVKSSTSRRKKSLGIKTRKGYKQAKRFKDSLFNKFKLEPEFYAELVITKPLTHSGAVYHVERWKRKKMKHNLYKSSLRYVKHEIDKKEFKDDNKFVHFNSMVYKPSKTSRRRSNNRKKKRFI